MSDTIATRPSISTSPATCWQPTTGRADKTALIDDAGTLTYGQLAEQVQRMAAAL